jgi:hypothetical protein
MTRGAPDGLIALARRAAGVAAVVALVASCGGGDDDASSSDGAYVALMRAEIPAQSPTRPDLSGGVR